MRKSSRHFPRYWPFVRGFTGRFPSQRPVRRSFDVFFDLRMNKWLNKQSRRRWSETPSCSVWRDCSGSATRFSARSCRPFWITPSVQWSIFGIIKSGKTSCVTVVSTVSADGPAPVGVRTYADTVMTKFAIRVYIKDSYLNEMVYRYYFTKRKF